MKTNPRFGRGARLGGLLAVALLLTGLAAHAADDNGAGVLDDVDSELGTVTVNERVYTVNHASELYDAEGDTMKLHHLDGHLGDWVLYRSTAGRGVRLLEALQLAPDDD